MFHTAERTTRTDHSENPIFQRHLIAYHEAAKRISGNVLEIGCGEGYGIPMLALHCNSYTAIDKFQTEVSNLPENAKFIQMSVPYLPDFADNSFDFVVSFQVIEHIEDDVTFLKEIHRVLKPGGTLIFTTPNRLMSLSRNPWHVREYTPVEMAKHIEKAFSTYDLQGVFGNEKVMDYYEKNKAGVQKFTRFDIFNLQYRLPRRLLQIPYDIANRMNRRMLSKQSTGLVNDIVWNDYFIAPIQDQALDYFAICTK
jgi:SAM-dependent methyltransferase